MNALPEQRTPNGSDVDPILDAFDIAYIIRRYFRIIIGIPILCGIIGLVYYFSQEPLYKGTALLLIDPRFDQIIQFEQIEGNSTDLDSLASLEVAMVADSMIVRVVEHLALREDKDFLPASLQKVADLSDSQLVDYLRKNRFSAKLLPGTRIVEIASMDPDPERARAIASAFATEFEAFLNEQRQKEVIGARLRLEAQAEKARASALLAEKKIRDFREAHPDFPVEQDHDLYAVRLSQFSEELNLAVRLRTELEGQAAALAGVDSESSPIAVVELGGYQSMPHVSDLLSQRTSSGARLAAIAEEWGNSHPTYQSAASEYRKNSDQLRELVSGIKVAIQSKYVAAQAKEDSLRKQVNELQKGLVKLKSLSSEFRVLQQQAEREWLVHESLQAQLGQSFSQSASGNIATVISEPLTPHKKASPSLFIAMLVAVAVGGFLTCAWIAFLILRGVPYTDKSQLQHRLGLPVVADLGASGGPSKSQDAAVLVHSLGISERKTTQISAPQLNGVGEDVTNLVAAASARSGAKCLLVIVDSKSGEDLEHATCRETKFENLWEMIVSAESAFSGRGMSEKMAELKEKFDHVFVEARGPREEMFVKMLSPLVDQNLVVVGKGTIAKRALDESIRDIHRDQMPPISLLLVDPKGSWRNGAAIALS